MVKADISDKSMWLMIQVWRKANQLESEIINKMVV